MSSLARRHRDKMCAMKRQRQTEDATLAEMVANATPYEILRAALGQRLVELKNIQSIEAKIERKRVILPDFEPWCDGILLAAQDPDFKPVDDDILSQVLVWQLDVGAFDKALPLAAHVLHHKLALPERFKRTAATMVAEEIAEAGLKAAAQGEAFPLAVLNEAEDLTALEDMPDEARAKLHKAIGLELQRQADALEDGADTGVAGGKRALVGAALTSLKRALELNSGAGVKKKIEQLERQLKALEPKE